jgi:hypothetical protein
MIIVWSPPDAPQQRFRFVPGETLSQDAEAVEEVGGRSWNNWDDFSALFLAGNRKAWRAALWMNLRRAKDPNLRFEDVQVRMGELDVVYDPDELARIRAALADADPDDPQAAALRDQIDAQAEAAEPAPKDDSETSGAPDDSTSAPLGSPPG